MSSGRPPFRRSPPEPQHRINGRIRAKDVRVIGADGQQLGVMDLAQAIRLAQNHGVDLVEIAPNAIPPVCRVVDYGKYKYEVAKKENEAKKTSHINEVKEVQLSPVIDPHDLGIKLNHAIGFLCNEMQVKINLRFRGRQNAHTEVGVGVVKKFLTNLAPWGQANGEVRIVGKAINLMVNPLPKQKRAKHPAETDRPPASANAAVKTASTPSPIGVSPGSGLSTPPPAANPARVDTNAAAHSAGLNSPFDNLTLPPS